MSLNIFQIWDSLGRITPFAVRRDNWTKEFYTIVERVECEKLPYGKAFGFSVAHGRYSNHYDYEKKWRETGLIPCCGCYQWTLVSDADLSIRRPSPATTKKREDRIKTGASTLRFGKYQGRTVDEIFHLQPSYLAWLIENVPPFMIALPTVEEYEATGFRFPEAAKALNEKKIGSIDN